MASADQVQDHLLQVDDLRTRIVTRNGEFTVVDGVSFELDAGETLCVVGESGSGKSMTALSVMRLVDPPGFLVEGRVLLDGTDVLRLPESDMRMIRGRAVSMIFQDPMTSLNPVLTVGAQICEAIRLHEPVSHKMAWRRSLEMLRIVGMSDPERRARQYPHEMSGGMRQRVMIAMALSTNPCLLIADEPTTALDVTIQAEILSLFKNFRGRTRLSILLITHDFGVVADIADRVLVMYAGQIVEQGTVHQIIEKPHHPYTKALLGSILRIGDVKPRLDVIDGSVPDALHWPRGCRFAPRCAFAMSICREQEPPVHEVDKGQWSRCWLDASAAASMREVS